ncbi:CRISPR-associated protein Cas4 [soil metagenome]
MLDDDAFLPISALQHLLFCERQCALIHIERSWVENRFTAEGRVMHAKAHDGPDEARGGVRIARGLQLRCARLGLVGVADVVEFHPAREGLTRRPFPVEYKRGKAKSHDADRVQLCAQALCLEEMFDVSIPGGALFYGVTRRRRSVTFDSALRELTEQTSVRLHALIASGLTPRAVREAKCGNCSMLPVCLPDVLTSKRTVAAYVSGALARSFAVPGTRDGDE